MVSISLSNVKRLRRVRKLDYERVVAAVMAVVGSLVLVWLLWKQPRGDHNNTGYERSRFRLRPNHPDLQLHDLNSDAYNAIAQDIIQTLDCARRFAAAPNAGGGIDPALGQPGLTGPVGGERGLDDIDRDRVAEELGDSGDSQRRRLEGLMPDALDVAPVMDDFQPSSSYRGLQNEPSVNAAILFCLAAHAEADLPLPLADRAGSATVDWKRKCHCNAQAPSRQRLLLDLWSTAHAELSTDVLIKTLEVAVEQERVLVGHTMHLWAPTGDDGLEYMMTTLNADQGADEGGIRGLSHNLGPNKLFVDVGSCLGLTSLAVALLYPGTQIVSIEAATPNWLLQEMNWRCNDEVIGDLSNVAVLLGGVGPQQYSSRTRPKLSSGSQMAKFIWRPRATTSARNWTPKSERTPDDVELTVKLRAWHDLLAQAEITANRIDVLNVDCEGCEYNLIPALSDAEFEAISTVMGSVHWGYIPQHKLPSSARGKKTHERLCTHENIARAVKECCAFPDLPISSSQPGEVLIRDTKAFPPKPITVKDVAGELCDGFAEWAKEHHLYSIDNDWDWFKLTSMAD